MRWYRTVAVGLLATLAGSMMVAVATRTASAVVTSGTSMAPRIHSGDLVLVRAASSYAVGDSVAYHSDELDAVVLHRIVEVRNDRYTFRGDNNTWLDPERPTRDELIGKELLHVPRGGIWLERATSPVALGLLAFSLLALGGNAARTRRARRRRKTMSQHTSPRTGRRLWAGLSPWATKAAAAAALLGTLGVVLGFVAWTAPTTPTGTTATAAGQEMRFSYTADVPTSPAYDDTTVTAPEPVFRKLTDTLEVEYAYRGAPGRIAVAAELSTAGGWRSTVPLRDAERFGENRYEGSVVLDLDALDKRAQAAAAATGIPAGDVTVMVVPTVTTPEGETFEPALALTLDSLQLALTGDESTLKVGGLDETTSGQAASVPTLDLAGREISVPAARATSLMMVSVAILALALLALLAWSTAPSTETDVIRRRHGHLVVEVQPVAAPRGRPVVDVVDFATLAKLAERYELLVLHWSRSDVETFVVQDEGTTYRYRTGSGLGQLLAEPAALGRAPHADATAQPDDDRLSRRAD